MLQTQKDCVHVDAWFVHNQNDEMHIAEKTNDEFWV
jgi:hypothetical protein